MRKISLAIGSKNPVKVKAAIQGALKAFGVQEVIGEGQMISFRCSFAFQFAFDVAVLVIV